MIVIMIPIYTDKPCQYNNEGKLQRLKRAEASNRNQHKKANVAETWYWLQRLSPQMGAPKDESSWVALATPHAPPSERNDITWVTKNNDITIRSYTLGRLIKHSFFYFAYGITGENHG